MTLLCLIFLLLSVCSLSAETKVYHSKLGADFDHLLFAQFWPYSSLVYYENKGEPARIPPGVEGWTIHGLWPAMQNKDEPNYCNNSTKFHYDQIKSLANRLEDNWPSYGVKESKTKLWAHEWDKHGTCAYSLPFLRGELRYFNQTLDLHTKLNTTKMLADSNIVPSKTRLYSPENIFNAVKKSFGKIPDIKCICEERTGRHHLEEVRLCFNKQLEPIDCPEIAQSRRRSSTHFCESMKEPTSDKSYYQSCPMSGTVHYMPIPRQ